MAAPFLTDACFRDYHLGVLGTVDLLQQLPIPGSSNFCIKKFHNLRKFYSNGRLEDQQVKIEYFVGFHQ
jgi:hypothetical protein